MKTQEKKGFMHILREEAQKDEFGESLARTLKNEESRAAIDGFGMTKQGEAFRLLRRKQLIEEIHNVRSKRRRTNNRAWKALRMRTDEDLADQLLLAGMDAAYRYEGETCFGHSAHRIGDALGFKKEVAIEVGVLGIELLAKLPEFWIDEKDVLILHLDEKIDTLMDDVVRHQAATNPLLFPLAAKPVPWTQFNKGVVPPGHWAQPSLISRHGKRIQNVVRRAIGTGDMQGVLDAGNALQDVFFVINKPILDLIEKLGAGNSLDVNRAKALAARGPFTVPKNFDFRGRIYDFTHFGFQREDFIRGLFLFEQDAPIGEDGTLMLMSHVAACADGINWGGVNKPSKLNFKQRLAWVGSNSERLRAIGNAILARAPLTKEDLPDDTPFQFAAAVVELVQALEIGPEFKTQLPLTFDASCSGLQHIAAMTGSEEGWMANLMPSEEACDIYTLVAEDVWFANLPPMMRGPDDRKIIKGPCVQYFYGSRVGGVGRNKHTGRTEPHAMTKAVCEELTARGLPWEGARQLAEAIHEAIERRITCAKEVRDFLESLARLYVKHGQEFRWTTPLGLPVLNVYLEPETKNVYLRVNGRRRTLKIAIGDAEVIREGKAIRAASPNFVHSMDACHLQMVVLAAQAEGIELLGIHDCFGCVAPHAERLNEIVRDQFIELHKHDLLGDLLEKAKRDLPKSVKLPPLPKHGNLDVEQVRYSFHAFK